jgi:hypothetical protein
MTSNRSQPLDRNGNVIMDSDWSCVATKTMTFDGATENDPGDEDGTGNPADLFIVSGTVLLRILAICNTDLAGAGATLEVGTDLSTAGLIALTTGTDIDENEIWHDASPDSSIEASSVLAEYIVSEDVIQTVKTANVTAGEITYVALWYPLSADASVVAA